MRVGTRPSPAVTKATTTPTTEHRYVHGVWANRFAGWLLLLAAWASGCAAPRAESPPARPAPPLHRGPPTDYVSAAGLRWLLLLKPQQLLADPELAKAVRAIVPDPRFDAFSESSGVDLRVVPSAAVAGFAYSTLYLAELPRGVASLARARFTERLLSGPVTKRPHPALVRIAGVIGQTPETLLTVEDRLLAVAVGDPLQAKIAEAYAMARLQHSPPALRGAALSSLPDLFANNAAVLLAPGPFADDWQRAANGLLQSTVAIGIAARPVAGKIATTICLAGAWGDSADEASGRLASAWTRFAESSAGRLFELNPVANVSPSSELLTLTVELDLNGLVRGLQASVLGDLSQILHLPEKIPLGEPAVPAN